MIIQTPMVPRSPVNVFAGSEAGQRAPARMRQLSRRNWVTICAIRLSQLRPDRDLQIVASVAADMWADVAAFDPVIAAEMEHEDWLADERDAACAEQGSNQQIQAM